MSYIIHGATGAQGGPVLKALQSAGKPVVAVSRKAVKLGDTRIAVADYANADLLTEAYRDADGVFVHLPLGGEDDLRAYAVNIVTALTKAQPGRVVVSTSGQIVDEPHSPLQQADGSALQTLLRGIAGAGLSHAVIAPRLFFENLLLPPVIEGVRGEGVLRYPLPAEFQVSWASHLDIADVAVALFERPDIEGIVAVGQLPALTGADLVAGFAARLGRDVRYQAISPEQFGVSITPLFGKDSAAGVAAFYNAFAATTGNAIPAERSAQSLLGIRPRTPLQWLTDLDL